MTFDKEKNEEKESNGEAVNLDEGRNSIRRRDTERLRVTEDGVEACTFRYAEPACSNKRPARCLKKRLPVFPASTAPGRVHPIQTTNRDLEIICAVAKNHFLRSTHLHSLIGGS